MTIQQKNFSNDVRISGSESALSFTPVFQRSLYARVFKRAFDLSLVILTAPIVLPAIVLLALIVAMDGHKPLYRQPRVGKNGRTFTMWKLRTMVHDADKSLHDYLESNETAREEWHHHQKLADDPRITLIGRLLRKTSLDELPQIWNVLTGDMSLVGPRPMMPNQQAIYPGHAYYELRPGLTGYWQISDRNRTTFADRARFDDAYYRDLNFKTDVSVLVSTVGVVLRGTGC